MEQENDELELSTWKNIENSAKKVSINLTQTCIKVGFREGISDGRDMNFQSAFDNGYKLGFETGFLLGYYKGVTHFQKHKQITNSLLESTGKGNCQFCSIKNIDTEKILNLELIQKNNHECLKQKLKIDFPEFNN